MGTARRRRSVEPGHREASIALGRERPHAPLNCCNADCLCRITCPPQEARSRTLTGLAARRNISRNIVAEEKTPSNRSKRRRQRPFAAAAKSVLA